MSTVAEPKMKKVAEMQQGREEMKHTISLYVANKPGVLIRISLVFARRGYNIDSLIVSPSSDPDFSVMNIVARGDQKVLDQILKQLNKLVDVVHASDRTGEDIIQREFALLKIHCEDEVRSELLQLAHALDCAIVDLGSRYVMLEVSGETERLDAIQGVFDRFGVMEMIRTGKVFMVRGEQQTA